MIKAPKNQKRLTNIAIVKYKSHGKRFEIACYSNKVLNWREGQETDFSEVVQTTTIFNNVGKGMMAPKSDVHKAFGDKSEEEICKIILDKGELQISDKERDAHLNDLFRQVATIVSEKCVSPSTGLPLTRTMVESLMKECHVNIRPGIPAKKQALKAMEILCSHDGGTKIARADMRLRIAVNLSEKTACAELLQKVQSDGTRIESSVEADGDLVSYVFECAPSHYRELDAFASEHNGTLQVLDRAVRGEARHPNQNEPSENAAGSSGYAKPVKTVGSDLASKGKGRGKTKGAAPKCSTCDYQSVDLADYREHCKSEWHAHNLKRKVRGLAALSQKEFDELALGGFEFLAVDAYS
eukprot:gene1283-161_t